MHKPVVAVLRGGPSSEYEVSLQSGSAVLQHMPEKYQALDVLIDKEGVWHISGVPRSIDYVLSRSDVVFNAMHGEYGEDGQIQAILDAHHSKYTGPRRVGAAIAMNKMLTKDRFKNAGLLVPKHAHVTTEGAREKIFEVFRTYTLPVVVKPVGAGSSVGIALAKSFKELNEAVLRALETWPEVLVEEYVPGIELTCGVIENFREQSYYATLPVEIRPPKERSFFDYEAKYTGITEEICPARISSADKARIQEAAILAHKVVDAGQYSRADFILSPKGLYVLETNTLPGLTPESLLPKPLVAVGCSMTHFLEHLIEDARRR